MFENPEVAFGGTRAMLEIIGNIYETVQAPELWPVVLEMISDAVHGGPMFMAGGTPDMPVLEGVRVDPAAVRDYLGYYASINVMGARCNAKFLDGTVRYGDRVIADAELEQTEFYADFFARYDMHYSFGINVTLEGMGKVYLSCQRPKCGGAFSEREGLVYQTLLPHLRRALELRSQFGCLEGRAAGLETALEAHDHAVIGVDMQGRVALCNRQAEALIQQGTGLRIVQGSLCCELVEDNRALQALLGGVLGGVTGGSATGAMLVHRANKSALRVTVSRFGGVLAGQAKALAALVFLSDLAQALPSRAETLRTLYGLTPTEGRIADLLLAGLEVREIAQQMRIALETARFHVKRVLAKTGARRQSELMRLMLGLPGTR